MKTTVILILAFAEAGLACYFLAKWKVAEARGKSCERYLKLKDPEDYDFWRRTWKTLDISAMEEVKKRKEERRIDREFRHLIADQERKNRHVN